MKFKANATDLAQALNRASVVRPVPVDSQGSTGYLFVVRGEKCYIYSQDEHQKSRVDFPIFDVEGEGAFVFPAENASVQYLEGWVEIEPDEEEGVHIVKYNTESGATTKKISFDPRALQALDKDLESASEGTTYPVALLKEALSGAKNYLADAHGQAKENFKTLQIFDTSKEEWSKGNGHLFASDGRCAYYFFCPDLKDKGLSVHTLRVGLLNSFLAKSEGDVTIRKSERSTYLVNSDDYVIGWVDQVVEHDKFGYYPLKRDGFILRASKDRIVKALQHVRSNLSSKKNRVRVEYNHEKKSLQFRAEDNGNEVFSAPVFIEPLDALDGTAENPMLGGDSSKKEDFAFNANIDQLLDMVSSSKSFDVLLRVGSSEKGHLIRTIEEFALDPKGKVVVPGEGEKVYQCRVTRFMPSMR